MVQNLSRKDLSCIHHITQVKLSAIYLHVQESAGWICLEHAHNGKRKPNQQTNKISGNGSTLFNSRINISLRGRRAAENPS